MKLDGSKGLDSEKCGDPPAAIFQQSNGLPAYPSLLGDLRLRQFSRKAAGTHRLADGQSSFLT